MRNTDLKKKPLTQVHMYMPTDLCMNKQFDKNHLLLCELLVKLRELLSDGASCTHELGVEALRRGGLGSGVPGRAACKLSELEARYAQVIFFGGDLLSFLLCVLERTCVCANVLGYL